jgi:hypothetical protein
MLLRGFLLSALLASGALPAAAFSPSCGSVRPLELYREAHASADRFLVLLGRLRLPEELGERDRQHEPFAAPFEGFALTTEGFTEPVSAPVRLVHFCDPDFLGLCGELRHGEETLLFARQAADGSLSVTVGPCGQWAQQFVDPSDLEELAACARGACPTTP